MKKNKTPIDNTDGDVIFTTTGNLGIDNDGHMMLRLSDNLAMDMDNGEVHLVSSWPDREDDEW